MHELESVFIRVLVLWINPSNCLECREELDPYFFF